VRRVAITGAGIVSPCGETLESLGEAVIAGRSAGAPVRSFDASGFPTRIAAQVPPDARASVLADPDAGRFARVDDWKSAFGVLAAKRALADAGWDDSMHPSRSALIAGTGLSSVTSGELAEDVLPFVKEGALDVVELARKRSPRPGTSSPLRHLTDSMNRSICGIARITGRSQSHFGACAASTQAIGDAFRLVRNGVFERALAGGADSMIHPYGMISFMLLGALSTRNETPAAACKPFHRERDGFLIGEGAAFFVLEELGAARAKGRRILAEIAGYGSSVDGYNVTAPRPDGSGAAAAMRHALRDAGVAAEAIGYVNAHGTGTELNDPAESRAVREVFGAHAARLPISSVKPVFGHTIAAAGAMEVATCLAAIALGALPPTPNLESSAIAADCEGLDHIAGSAREGVPPLLMTNNYGFGGQNASLILARPR
jgi:3-oxoacyl-[acyl-carrier-protein] synthase II